MIIHPSSKDRPFHFGSFPMETLPRDARVIDSEALRPARVGAAGRVAPELLARAADRYRDIYAGLVDGPVAPAKAPVGEDLAPRVMDLKGGAYFLDASLAGICALPASAWLPGSEPPAHRFALAVLIEHARVPETENLAHDWARPAVGATADMRVAEIAVALAGHLRFMGFQARAHFPGHTQVDLAKIAVLAGVAVRTDQAGNALEAPFIGTRFSLAVITTDYALAVDLPLHADALKPAKRGEDRSMDFLHHVHVEVDAVVRRDFHGSV